MAYVLCMEDDKNLAMAMKRQLRGHEVTVVTSVQQCQLALESRKPDLLLLDLHVTDGTGFDVLNGLRSSDIETLSRTVLLTGGSMNLDEQQQLDATEVPVMIKPVPTRTLKNMLAVDEPDPS